MSSNTDVDAADTEPRAQPDDASGWKPENVEQMSKQAASEHDLDGDQKAEMETKKSRSKKSKRAEKRSPEDEALEMRLLRLQADFDNFRKRMLREKNELYNRANEEIMQELLPVLDHSQLALSAAREHEAPEALLEGFSLVNEQLLSVLKKFKLSVIDAEGAEFDPNLHEAISHINSEEIKDGWIIAQVRKGYMLGDRLLRPAQVVVSSGAPDKKEFSSQVVPE